MAVSPRGISIQSLYKNYREGVLLVNRQYQRKLVWTVAEKQHLIDSILKDYPMPLFLLAEKPSGSNLVSLEIIDGMQRLNAIFSFIEHSFTYNGRCFDIREFPRARQAAEAGCFVPCADNIERISALDCANILDYQLAVTVVPSELDSRITDVFGRINSGGRQLSDQERRQAGVLSGFAEVVRHLAAEIRGDVSRDSLLLSQMPEISIETSRNLHGYALKAEDIFWCYQGVLRTSDLRDSEDEQVLADICSSILLGRPAEASGDFLNRVYKEGEKEYVEVNRNLAQYGKERLIEEVKNVFSTIRSTVESHNKGRFAFRDCVYRKPTSNALKAPFFAVFMAFYELIFKEGMTPVAESEDTIMQCLTDLSDKIAVGKKNLKTAARQTNVNITKGLIRDQFVRSDSSVLTHGPAMSFDFENSIRRSRTETGRYEFKQGLLRLDKTKTRDPNILQVIVETICGIANCGPHADGYLYIGIADTQKDAARVQEIYNSNPVEFDRVFLVGVDREATQLGLSLDTYVSQICNHIANSGLSDPLKTQVGTNIDVIKYKEVSIVRVRIPRQSQVSFVDDICHIRNGSSTVVATAPQTSAVTTSFAAGAPR
ncbi:hypothetical protein BSF38_05098 [Paludisphaera borealis]|uniref:DUF262 domain-containing protein n=2 Tax=Paludisphaera borealis TaxID=1387353 RepID=A0A1U7CX99_9BACT|nr:hypothetical protein BSF38_05098 [Paludisphaera borealis]